jgi:hypothetical protein
LFWAEQTKAEVVNNSANNTNQAADSLRQMNNQMYQQKQDRKTNIQLQQINNNLNGIRYGY